jgi:hypothetical protein
VHGFEDFFQHLNEVIFVGRKSAQALRGRIINSLSLSHSDKKNSFARFTDDEDYTTSAETRTASKRLFNVGHA